MSNISILYMKPALTGGLFATPEPIPGRGRIAWANISSLVSQLVTFCIDRFVAICDIHLTGHEEAPADLAA
ncbi:hypothetical protein pkon1_p19 [Paracoccus phage vB_PkoS_Pkon1]|nr:hypothetical protein pkon1_p19 [Paracoccus phage vB_PkoS_Pkon1]